MTHHKVEHEKRDHRLSRLVQFHNIGNDLDENQHIFFVEMEYTIGLLYK